MTTRQCNSEDTSDGWLIRHMWSWGIAGLAVFWIAGCGNTERSAPPRTTAMDAEEDFEWAMERLTRAVKEFQPPSGLGFRVQREMDYKLIPPSEEKEHYSAVVTISSKTIYDHALADDNLITSEERPQRKPRQEFDPDAYSLPGEDGEPEIDRIVGINTDPGQIDEPLLQAREIVESEDYQLIYVDGSWQLDEEIDVEHVKIWFDYALTL